MLRIGAARPDRTGFLLLAAVPAVLALAATQPALARTHLRHVRLDAAVFFVLDVSRSMQAAPSPAAPTRLDRAREAAIRLRSAVPDVPSGVASFTDRVVPLLFPTADAGAFDSTVREAIHSETPPPLELAPVATNFDALGALGSQGFFSSAQRHRIVVLLSDGESEPFDASSVASGLDGASLVVVSFWAANDRVYDGSTPEPDYRPDRTSAERIAELTAATGGRSFASNRLAAAASAIRADAGHGKSSPIAGTQRRVPLAPWVALATLVPLALLARRRLLASF